MRRFKTVLGSVYENEIGITLPHEHICCFSDYLYDMGGKFYFDKEKLIKVAIKYLTDFKEKYSVSTIIDCTPVNIGRDIELLKEVSRKSKINIICSTGFYYTEDPLFNSRDVEYLSDLIISDAKKNNVGIIKCAIEKETLSAFEQKILASCAMAQSVLKLPIVLHTNAQNKNAVEAVKLLMDMGVKPQAITVAHLSDSDDIDYIKRIAKFGCFIGFDRMYNICRQDYISKTVWKINELCSCGYEKQLLISHDALFFNGFQLKSTINEKPRFNYCFDYILPLLSPETCERITKKNVLDMLKCGE